MKKWFIIIALSAWGLSAEAQSADRLISADQLLTASRQDVAAALRTWMPEMDEQTLIVVDGKRVPHEMLTTLSIYDIEHAKVVNDPVSLSAWGIYGHSVVELTTRKVAEGALRATYRLDASLTRAAGSSGQLPRQTGWQHLHQLDVEGRDAAVAYLGSARLSPNGRGVLKGNGNDALGLRAYIGYRWKALLLHNDMTFHHGDEELSSGVRYLRENSQGSFETQKTASLADRFGLELDVVQGLRLSADFSFVNRSVQQDMFLSPVSGWFADTDDVRLHGTYRKGNRRTTTYEGGVRLDFNRTLGLHRLTATASGNFYSGEMRDENYGGMGVLSDRMGYISFTLGYDTLRGRSAGRNYERTLRGHVGGSYEFGGRYGATASATLSHSSLLAPDHRTVAHWAARAYWHLHGEQWMKDCQLNPLTLAYTYGESGYVPFTWHDFTTTYRNNSSEQYIYNYYLTGSSLQGLANTSLKPARTRSHQLSAYAGMQGATALLRVYHAATDHLLTYDEQPLETGFRLRAESNGQLTANGMELTASAPLVRGETISIYGQLMLGYEHCSADGMANSGLRRNVTRGSVGLGGTMRRWNMSLSLGGNNDLGQSCVQAGYNVGRCCRWIGLWVGVCAENLVCWHPNDLLMQRRYGISLKLSN